MPELVFPKRVDPTTKALPVRGPIGVVIPAYNAADTIGACAASLLAQQGVEVDLVVVDDASTDQTAALAEAAGARVVRRDRNGGPAAARNDGARAVTGDILFFTEADGRYAPDHLMTCLRALGDPEVGAAIALGVRAWSERDSVVRRLGDALWAAMHSLVMAGRRGTGAWCYRREVFTALGGFDESLRHGEDVELAGRVASLGYRTGVAGWSTMTHRNPDRWRSWFVDACRNTAGRRPSGGAKRALHGLRAAVLLGTPAAACLMPWLWWVVAAILAVVSFGAAEQRLALKLLWRQRDWRTMIAAPVLFWLRRLGFSIGHLPGRYLARVAAVR